MAKDQATEQEKRAALEKIVKGAQTAFFVTQTEKGTPLHGRPMANAKVEDGLAAIWFATQKRSGKVSEIAAEREVLLGYTNASGSEWASVSGTARLVDDRAKIKELWNPIWKNWFDGPDDPNIELICVKPREAEYWDSGSRALAMVKFAIAAVTGVKMDDGTNERVRMG